MAKKIIIADDDAGILELFQIIFERAGYEVVPYLSGSELFEEHEVPAIYLLDKQLSGIDGLDICRHLKKQAITGSIPVVLVSATPGIGQLAIEAGADGFIEKPFDIADLLRIVEKNIAKTTA